MCQPISHLKVYLNCVFRTNFVKVVPLSPDSNKLLDGSKVFLRYNGRHYSTEYYHIAINDTFPTTYYLKICLRQCAKRDIPPSPFLPLVPEVSVSHRTGHSFPNSGPMARFSLDLHELEAANALRSLSEVPETQLSTEKILRQLSSDDSEVMFRKVQGSGEVLHTRPGVYLHKVTVPMARSIREWCGSASTRAPSD